MKLEERVQGTIGRGRDGRLRILALGPQSAWPATDGGKEGILGAICAIARHADLIYVCPCPEPTEESKAFFRSVGIDYRPVDFVPADDVRTIMTSTIRLEPFKFAKYGNGPALAAFRPHMADLQPDAIICFHAHTMKLGQRLRQEYAWDVPILLREHNIEYDLVASYRQSLTSPIKQALALPFEWMTRRAEQSCWTTADTTAFLSDRDFKTATATGRVSKPLLAREGVPIPPRRDVSGSMASRNLLIPLNPRAVQSLGNLRRFLQDYWLKVASVPALDGVGLAITGVDAKRLAELTDIPVWQQDATRIKALGFLPDLSTAFQMASVLVSPTFVGGGIRKKVLEGMAHQLPVIATDLDIDTCSFFDPPRNILRLGDPSEFAGTVSSLLNDRDWWLGLSQAGRATVEEYADWDGFARTMVERAGQLIADRRPTS